MPRIPSNFQLDLRFPNLYTSIAHDPPLPRLQRLVGPYRLYV